ncbi:hypothetical protein HDU93_007018, partial [Gonapodya sp. JEL0774]
PHPLRLVHGGLPSLGEDHENVRVMGRGGGGTPTGAEFAEDLAADATRAGECWGVAGGGRVWVAGALAVKVRDVGGGMRKGD